MHHTSLHVRLFPDASLHQQVSWLCRAGGTWRKLLTGTGAASPMRVGRVKQHVTRDAKLYASSILFASVDPDSRVREARILGQLAPSLSLTWRPRGLGDLMSPRHTDTTNSRPIMNLLDLPNELLVRIVTMLFLRDVKTVRLVNRQLGGATELLFWSRPFLVRVSCCLWAP